MKSSICKILPTFFTEHNGASPGRPVCGGTLKCKVVIVTL